MWKIRDFPQGALFLLPVQWCHRSPKPPAVFTIRLSSGSRIAFYRSPGLRISRTTKRAAPVRRNPRFPAPRRRLLDIAQGPIPNPRSDHCGPTQVRWRDCFFTISREFPPEAVSSDLSAGDRFARPGSQREARRESGARNPFLWDATNKSARFSAGMVIRRGFWRHWGVWGDRSHRSVLWSDGTIRPTVKNPDPERRRCRGIYKVKDRRGSRLRRQ